MTVSVGDRLPETTFFIMGADGLEKKTTSEILRGRKLVLFGVPGAFTHT